MKYLCFLFVFLKRLILNNVKYVNYAYVDASNITFSPQCMAVPTSQKEKNCCWEHTSKTHGIVGWKFSASGVAQTQGSNLFRHAFINFMSQFLVQCSDLAISFALSKLAHLVLIFIFRCLQHQQSWKENISSEVKKFNMLQLPPTPSCVVLV